MNHDDNNVPSFSPEASNTQEPTLSGSDTLVHTQESTEHGNGFVSYRSFLLSGLGDKPKKVEKLFSDIDVRDGTNRLRAWRGCRSSAWFVQHQVTGEIRVASRRCHLRWCPLCARTDRFATTQAVKEKLLSVKSPRFMTLTLKHSSNNLSDQIDHLYDSFKRLRRQKNFKSHVAGGVWFFQIKWIDSSQEWHPHIHILWTGKYYPQEELSRDWNKASSGSFIVDVRWVKDIEKSAEYVARYATEPANLSELTDIASIQVYDSLFHRKIKGCFGTWSDVKLGAVPPDDSAVWEYVGGYFEIMLFRRKYAVCADIVDAWLTGEPCAKVIEPPPIPPPDPEPVMEVLETYRQLTLWRE